jgi:two-component system cell cycle sensor histidine kinase/response regulator CckA
MLNNPGFNDPGDELRKGADQFRKLVEHAPEGIFIQCEGRFVYLNPAALGVYGAASAEQLLGQPVDERVHPVCRHLAAERIRRASQLQKSVPASQEMHLKLDGTVLDVEVSAAPAVYEDRDGAVVFLRDVTRYKQAETKQRLNRALLHSIIEGIEGAVYAKDHGGRYVLVNSAACSMVGKQADEILGRDDTVLFAPDAALAGMENDQTLIAMGPGGTRQEELTLASGDRIMVRTTEGLVLDEDGYAFGLFGIAEDITERKRSEAEGAKLREQLLDARKLESIGRMAAGVAHDLNNLLTIIKSYSDLMLGRFAPNDPIYEDATEIGTAGERAIALCHQLLVLGRKQIPPPRCLNLNDLIADVEKLLVGVMGGEVRLATDLRPSLGQVQADPGLLHQVLMDLAVNARDAMPGGGTLRIATEDVDLGHVNGAGGYAEQHPEVKPGPYVQLKVSDTGIGMTQEVMARLFEPFFTTKTPDEGRGLGLATVYGIVKQSGGSIFVSSEPGAGTTFKIYLPRVPALSSGGMGRE